MRTKLIFAFVALLAAFPHPDLNQSSGTNGPCDTSVIVNQASATTTQLVAAVAGKKIFVCGATINQVGATTPPTFKFVSGTGTNCATGQADVTGVFTGANIAGTITNVVIQASDYGMIVPAGSALCITTTTTQAQKGVISYSQR